MEKSKVLNSILYPIIFVVIIWIVKVAETVYHLSFHTYGIYPLNLEGLKGIIFSPFIHGDYNHLISNTIPVFVLGTALFYFYKEVAFRVLILSWLITGIWVWIIARPSWHIGASGVVYSLAAFLFASGVIRKHPRLMAISLLVVFIYGGMVWGIFPIKERISWESHLMGMICGFLLAWFFRAYGPQRAKYSWELEEEDGMEDEEYDLERHFNSQQTDQSIPLQPMPKEPTMMGSSGENINTTHTGSEQTEITYHPKSISKNKNEDT